MAPFFPILLFLHQGLFISGIYAHSYVSSVTLDGVTYFTDVSEENISAPPPTSFYEPSTGIFRRVPGIFPVEDLDSIDVQCHGWQDSGTKPAPLTASVQAGSTMEIQWDPLPAIHYGSFVTYLAKCPGDCADFDPGHEAVWFKIQEEGKLAEGAPGKWATESWIWPPDKIGIPDGFTPPLYHVQVPVTLAPGNYLVRHEIINIHVAYSYPGIQLLPNCFQIAVYGNGTEMGPELKVAFPGAYQRTDQDIIYQVWTNTGPYTIPGPPVWDWQAS